MARRGTVKFINSKCEKFVKKAVEEGDSLKHLGRYEGMRENLIRIIAAEGMNVKVHFFGSRIIGLARADSDLDIFIEHGNNFYSNKDAERDKTVIERLCSAISNGGLWKVEAKILKATVPIIKVIYIPTNLKCDISVSNGLGVKNSLIIQYLFDLQPEAKRFYHFMNIFMKRYKKYFEGYLQKLLVIFFLQSEKVFPSIKSVQEDLYPEIIDGWPTQFDPKRNLSYYGLDPMMKFKSYVPRFFQFYDNFDYWENVMSIYSGTSIERVHYSQKNEIEDQILCIFGPINQEHNIGKYPTERDVEYFILLCESLAYEFAKKYSF